jgi:hypothetical protein
MEILKLGLRLWKRVNRVGPALAALGLAGVLLVVGSHAAKAQVVFSATTGHYYEAVAGSITWTAARDAAKTRTYLGRFGHLVSINSAAEQSFLTGTFPTAVSAGYWIGAYQDKSASDFSEPVGGWRWTTGEPWSYTSWNSGEPNNNGGFGPSEDFAVFAQSGNWNDSGTTTSATAGYVVEYEYSKFTFDVNSDGHADIVLQNNITNQLSFWYLNGTTYLGGGNVSLVPSAGYALQGTGDFNGDGKPDFVFQNTTTRQIAIWYMNGTSFSGGVLLPYTPAEGYKLAAVADFNGDGLPDLVFQNASLGRIAIWYMSGGALIGAESTQATVASNYKVVGAADFNGDGQNDLVFQNTTTGQIVLWYMNGGQYQAGEIVHASTAPSYAVVGVNDYNGDSVPDLVFQNKTTGQVVIWYMNGATMTGGDVINVAPGANNSVAGPH